MTAITKETDLDTNSATAELKEKDLDINEVMAELEELAAQPVSK